MPPGNRSTEPSAAPSPPFAAGAKRQPLAAAHRQEDRDGGAAADLTVQRDSAAVQLDEALRQRQAEPRPLEFAIERGVELVERAEDLVEILARDADAGVAHRH